MNPYRHKIIVLTLFQATLFTSVIVLLMKWTAAVFVESGYSDRAIGSVFLETALAHSRLR